tara:strand:- start:376 stop:603 length:228 start_codon:yes stop_codon:yes gene_type:complete
MMETNCRFNTFQQADTYIKTKKFRYKEKFIWKGEKAYIYKNKKATAYVNSLVDYLDKDTMDRGTVWIVTTFKGEA